MPRRATEIDVQRRRFLAQAGRAVLGFSAIGTAGNLFPASPAYAAPELPDVSSVPAALKGSGEVRVVCYGGTVQDAQRRAYFEPFERLTGIKVRDFPGADLNKLKAMVDTGTVEWDVVQLGRSSVRLLNKKGDYFEKIDYGNVDVDNIDPIHRYEHGCEMLVFGQVMAYRTDGFNGAVPHGWADFWDVKKFPGDRTLGGAGPSTPELEFALMAAGVEPGALYPLDLDKAFASYDKIKGAIVKWWETGAVPTQMLTDREVALATVWNGRMAALEQAGVPAAVSWDQGLLKRDSWTVPKGAKNLGNAMKFIAFSTMPVPQARLSMQVPYGFVNNKTAEIVPPRQLALLPTAPELKSKLINYDYDWWADNREKVIERWSKWVLG
jgi:putative spermidine/putrescine transport system substrate-binding protein